MQIGINVSYILLALLALWYLYYLLSTHSKTSPTRGRNKKIVKILRQYDGIRRNHTQRKQEMLEEVERLFYNDTSVDCRKMLNSLMKLKNNQPQTESPNGASIISQIDILCNAIRDGHKYMNVASESAQLFQSLEDAVEKSLIQDAKKYLSMLYTQNSAVEDSLRRKGKKEFWVGTALALLGFGLSVVQLIIQLR